MNARGKSCRRRARHAISRKHNAYFGRIANKSRDATINNCHILEAKTPYRRHFNSTRKIIISFRRKHFHEGTTLRGVIFFWPDAF